jgi:F-type H+-transporting ATPase subunit b
METTGGLWDQIIHSNVLNLLLVLLVIGWALRKQNIGAGIESQRQKIADELQTVEQQKQAALSQLETVKRQTANLQSEVDGILKNAQESAQTISAQLLSDARAEAGKIVDNAKKRVALEQRAAMKNLQARLLTEAVDDAREEMARSLSVADQKRSVEAFLDDLSAMKGAR